MIDTDLAGNTKLAEILNADPVETDWTIWEEAFLERLGDQHYEQLTNKQKNIVSRLYDKLMDL